MLVSILHKVLTIGLPHRLTLDNEKEKQRQKLGSRGTREREPG